MISNHFELLNSTRKSSTISIYERIQNQEYYNISHLKLVTRVKTIIFWSIQNSISNLHINDINFWYLTPFLNLLLILFTILMQFLKRWCLLNLSKFEKNSQDFQESTTYLNSNSICTQKKHPQISPPFSSSVFKVSKSRYLKKRKLGWFWCAWTSFLFLGVTWKSKIGSKSSFLELSRLWQAHVKDFLWFFIPLFYPSFFMQMFIYSVYWMICKFWQLAKN